MNLKSTETIAYSAENLTQTKIAMEELLADPQRRSEAERLRASLPADAPTDLLKTLDIIIRTSKCYTMPSVEAKQIRDETGRLESELEIARNQMNLGYTDQDGTFVKASSVALRNLMRTADDESVRKAAFDGLNSIAPFVLEHGFVQIIKLRNKLAKQLGFLDYYDYKCFNAEGFGKVRHKKRRCVRQFWWCEKHSLTSFFNFSRSVCLKFSTASKRARGPLWKKPDRSWPSDTVRMPWSHGISRTRWPAALSKSWIPTFLSKRVSSGTQNATPPSTFRTRAVP